MAVLFCAGSAFAQPAQPEQVPPPDEGAPPPPDEGAPPPPDDRAAASPETQEPASPEAAETKNDSAVDLLGGISSDPSHTRGWERPPERPGRGPLAWVGRGFGYAGYLVTSALFAPARGLIYLEAHHHTLTHIKEFFYNDAGTAGVIPIVAFASGSGLSFGAKAFHNDLFGHEEEVSLRAAYGFAVGQELSAKISLPHLASDRLYILFRGRWEKQNNLVFQGIGNPDEIAGMDLDPRASAIETRYAERRFLGLLSGGTVFHPGGYRLTTGASLIGNDRKFDATVDPGLGTSIGDVYDTSLIQGFDEGVDLLEVTADLGFDSRPNRGPDSSGVTATGFAGGPVVGEGFSFIHYGVELAGYWQPWWPRRTFVFRVAHEAVRGNNDEIPFTDLPRVGGAGLLRGYHRDRFRDKRAGVATLEYHYPIHENLSGEFFVEAGKVAATYDALVASGLSDNWNVGVGGGLLAHTHRNVKIRLDVAYGDGVQVYLATDVLEAFHSRGKEL